MPTRSDFESFWSAYPRKVGKLAALREWEKLQPPIAEVLAALAWQVPTWHDPQYVPHPRTWLHQGRWMDEPEQPKVRERKCWNNHTPACTSSSECQEKFLNELRAQRGAEPLRAVK